MGTGPLDIFRAGGPAQGVSGAGRPQVGSLGPSSGRAGATGEGVLPRKARPGFRGLGLPPASHCARAWGPRRRPGRRFRDARPGSLAGRPRRGSARFSEWHVRLGPCQMPRWAEVRGRRHAGVQTGPWGLHGQSGALTFWPVAPSFLPLIVIVLGTAKLCIGCWHYKATLLFHSFIRSCVRSRGPY